MTASRPESGLFGRLSTDPVRSRENKLKNRRKTGSNYFALRLKPLVLRQKTYPHRASFPVQSASCRLLSASYRHKTVPYRLKSAPSRPQDDAVPSRSSF